MQTVANKAPVTVQAGGFWDSVNGGLNTALGAWGKVEQIKAAKAASGQDVAQARAVPELPNGAAIQVDRPQVSPAQKDDKNIIIGGIKMDKNILIATFGLMGAVFLYKKLS